ncbi:prepilin-type N-terminal cleavage/methylation domain-containing protein [Robbsia sp. Bb-Pol-6]|uniref:Prepilin-type N-terminal cleavage/methylation domain-containing protein n=1 Tax=Robbsia betulipollinis TaxID=2981849 RepID=A0ABT3ZMB1_9BURK|nr:type IV pilin protein [Robbsia betulipollinis]MCY0387664.1 prepilin-type N-terminal cleavage/methylation domain-containing protein [Robbsia betulipollinis]
MTMHAPTRGMTLIETMLALLIAALVSAYAVPAYREYVARGHRQSAVHALYACALQREAGDGEGGAQRSLQGDGAGAEQGGGGACTATTAAYGISVRIAHTGAARDMPVYIIEAMPRSCGPQRADRCGIFTLDALGRRGNRRTDAHGRQTFEGCWSGTRH